ncbi:TetR family transcriptional regulator [Streptomyces profundus]|uniref:TetR family transcriptional regulator n=1 Tax=Streptomyces profundus TaxID=2867410 RepID=UPI001D16787D|nr:TetR family transcriptional regulator [Streptomyces sp. MA3_2.13]UED85968.1 TetR/AcrR family transcriptional regulator [Streptomyces sp. MA3_2.13]
MTEHESSGRRPTLRERKKLRTRQALVTEALRRFTTRGFAETTLDELVEAVEISQRTFFRNFASKEDVALAPEQELWATYVDVFARQPAGDAPFADYQRALFATVASMDEGWAARFRDSRTLAERTPALAGHSLRNCAEATDRVLGVTARGPEEGPDAEVRLRLLLELMLSAWRWAVHDWLRAEPGPDDREGLLQRARHAFALLPEVAALASA